MSALERLGEEVARAAGSAPPAETRERVRARLLAGATPRARLRGFGYALACAIVLSLLGGTLAFRAGHSRGLEATTARGTVVEGAWLTATAESPLGLAFGDRGQMKLAARARGRLARLSPERVELALEDGAVDVDVKPKSGTSWGVAAGPYRVEVLGTAFQTRWNVATKQLEVQVTRGLVRVVGGSLDEEGIRLHAGDRLELDATDGRAVLMRKNALGAPAGSAASDTAAPASSSAATPSESMVPTPAPDAVGPVVDFRELARQAKYPEALALAEKSGFEALTRSLGAADLKLLTDVARYQRQSARAKLALLALRRRFPKSAEGATATFLLGRLAAEQERDYLEAAKWFATYSQEHPSGSMAGEALGRRAQVLAQAGDAAAAKLAASQYLARFPEGAYAKVARGLVDGQTLRADP